MSDRRPRVPTGTLLALAALAVVAAALPASLEAQGRQDLRPVHGRVGIAADLALPVGQFHQYVANGFGVHGFGLLALDPRGILGLRLDASYVIYGHQRRVVPLSTTVPLIDVDVTTDNQIVFGSFGPQLTLPLGRVRPFLRGGVGISYFVTTSSARGISTTTPFARTNNEHDTRLALEGAGGVWIHLGGSHTPIDLSLEATYVHNGRTRYLTKESIVSQPDGSVTVTPVRSGANLVTVSLGVVFGIR